MGGHRLRPGHPHRRPHWLGQDASAFLWALDHLHRLALEGRLEDRVYVVYVSPLRALNNDIEKNLRGPLAGIGERRARRWPAASPSPHGGPHGRHARRGPPGDDPAPSSRAHHHARVALHPAPDQRALPACPRAGALRHRGRGPRAHGHQARRAPGAVARAAAGAGVERERRPAATDRLLGHRESRRGGSRVPRPAHGARADGVDAGFCAPST